MLFLFYPSILGKIKLMCDSHTKKSDKNIYIKTFTEMMLCILNLCQFGWSNTHGDGWAGAVIYTDERKIFCVSVCDG